MEGLLKVIVLGETNVGKTELINYLNCGENEQRKRFSYKHRSTVSPEFVVLSVYGEDLKSATVLQVWDTAGEERFRSLQTPFYRDFDGLILMFDVTKRSTFEKLKELKAEFFKCYGGDLDEKKLPVIVLGNKIDLKDKRQVTRTQAEDYCRDAGENYLYIEKTVKDDVRSKIEDVWITVVTYITKRKQFNTLGDCGIDIQNFISRRKRSTTQIKSNTDVNNDNKTQKPTPNRVLFWQDEDYEVEPPDAMMDKDSTCEGGEDAKDGKLVQVEKDVSKISSLQGVYIAEFILSTPEIGLLGAVFLAVGVIILGVVNRNKVKS